MCWPSPDVRVRARARAGDWMPQTEFTLGVGWIPEGSGLAFGLDYKKWRLGWPQARDVVGYSRVKKSGCCRLKSMARLGWMWGKDVSANSLLDGGCACRCNVCQGLVGPDTWGLPNKSKGPILIESDSVFGRPKSDALNLNPWTP